jgi:hypothetical protein
LVPFKEFSALDAHPGWHPISSNEHHFLTILTEDFENFENGCSKYESFANYYDGKKV